MGVSVPISTLCIPTMVPFLREEICGPILGIYKSLHIGAEAAQFPEKEYINGIAVAVQGHSS